MFERRRVDIKCLQEVRYRGQGTRVYGGEEKFWWSRSEENRNEGVRSESLQSNEERAKMFKITKHT